jgi:hypothetical protein
MRKMKGGIDFVLEHLVELAAGAIAFLIIASIIFFLSRYF